MKNFSKFYFVYLSEFYALGITGSVFNHTHRACSLLYPWDCYNQSFEMKLDGDQNAGVISELYLVSSWEKKGA